MSTGIANLAVTVWVLHPFVFGGVSGTHEGEASRLYQDKTDQDLAM